MVQQEQILSPGAENVQPDELLHRSAQLEFGLVPPWPGQPRVLELSLARTERDLAPGDSEYELNIERVGDVDDGRDVGHPLRNRPEAQRDGGIMPNCAVAWVMLRALLGPPELVARVLGVPEEHVRAHPHQRRLCNARLLQALACLLTY